MKLSSRKGPVLIASILLPMAVMTVVMAVCGICPFGSRSLGVMDMTHQYISFLYSLRDILAGQASFLYLPGMCLGGNMAGVAAYYLMSPLNLLTCLFPREQMYQAVSLLYILRVGQCGLTMSIYAGRRHGYGWRCLIPAMAYAFMAYMLAYSFNYLWQDCVILLPLVALGLARLRAGKGHWLYIITLAASLSFNFYLGYILCIFSVLFFLFEFFSVPRTERTHSVKVLLRFALSSLAAGALAAVVLLPAFLSLSNGKAEFSLSVLTLTAKFDFPRLFSKLFIGAFNYEEIMPAGMPNIFCGTVTTALAVLYFANGKIPPRRRILTGGLLVVLALSFWITALDLIWHCLNTPSWYNYRYSFLFSFLLAAAADQELSVLREGTRPWHLLLPVGVCAVMSALVFFGQSYEYVTWRSAAAALAITAAVCAALWVTLRPKTGKRLACGLAALVFLLHVGDLAVNAKLSLAALTIPSSDPDAYAQYTTAKGEAFALVPDDGTYTRTESPSMFDMNRCESMLFAYDGLSHYGSTISQASLDFLDRLGMDRYTDLWALYGAGVTGAADSFLAVRYIVSDTETKPYTPVASTDSYTIWENPCALPIAWTADAAIADTIPDMDCFSYMEALYAAATPEVTEPIFTPAVTENVSTENFAVDGTHYTRLDESPATITYTLTVQESGLLYGELEIPDFPGVMIFVNDTYCAYYATAQTNGSFYLGEFAAGDTVTVRVQASADIIVSRAAFATERADGLAAYSAALSQGGCALEKLSASHYTGTFTTGELDQYLVFTIPYDSAWTITLDGQPATPQMIQDCLMAVAVTAGTHTVELRYIPAGLVPGAVVSAAALAVCAGLFIRQKKHKT